MAAQQPTFKPYYQNQMMAIPPTLDELVAKGHPVRVVNDVINRINIQALLDAYHIKGSSSYHPQMLLKVLVYGYVSNVYSSRKLEVACRENINFMSLSGMSYPNHNTINRFRGARLKNALRNVFEEVVKLLAEEGVLSIEDVYTDGTKIEANANKYTFVWKKSIQTNKEKMKAALNDIWEYAQGIARSEDNLPEPPDLSVINKDNVQSTVDKLNDVLAGKPTVNKKMKARLRYVTKNYPSKIAQYGQQEAILGDRNSFSKTDRDATFMRMKEDHMKNGQLRPGYNIQISTSNQYIVNYTVHPNPTDTGTLQEHLQQHESSFGKVLKSMTADAGYGSEENYALLADKDIEAYVKYNMFDKGQKGNYRNKKPFSVDRLHYNRERDCYICPMGQPMDCIGTFRQKTGTGFEQQVKKYQAKNCSSCPLNGACHKAKGNRIIQVNDRLEGYRARAHDLLNSELGIQKRKQRCCDVEPVFANIKNNHGFRRFMLRGKDKVSIEWGLLAIAQNLRKKAA